MSCAQGFEPEGAFDSLSRGTDMGAVVGNVDAGDATSDEGPAPTVYMGEPCMMGETAACMCTLGTEGTKVCQYDDDSPTRGSFSECRACADPAPPPGDVTSDPPVMEIACANQKQDGSETDVDCGGPDCPNCLLGKKCSDTSDCSAGECVSGTCERTDAPTGGSTGGGGCMGGCSQPCFPVGILPCCRIDGRSCGCTWAPGAYCL